MTVLPKQSPEGKQKMSEKKKLALAKIAKLARDFQIPVSEIVKAMRVAK